MTEERPEDTEKRGRALPLWNARLSPGSSPAIDPPKVTAATAPEVCFEDRFAEASGDQAGDGCRTARTARPARQGFLADDVLTVAHLSTAIDIGTLIVRSPDIRGGRPRVAGSGVTVRRIVSWYKLRLNPEEIASRIGHLTLAQVYAALAYYHVNCEEIEADLASEDAALAAIEQQQPRPSSTA